MIARIHYDRETLDEFLHDRLAAGTEEVTRHIESCDDCQSIIEDMAEANLTWQDAAELLRDAPQDFLNCAADFPIGAATDASSADRPRGQPDAVSFLEPSDDLESIGRFARYEIIRVLGRGGMGIVMQAMDTSLGRLCAVKVLAPELACSAAARQRFSREAKSAAAVVHPHVVPIQTVDEHEGLPYLVMPVVEGPSLQQRVDQNGPLSLIETVRIAAQIADGLSAAHQQSLVHRDIKPANILLENGVERVQITDFGLARAVDDASMTRSGVIAGTPQYMSPEQAHGDSIDHRSDLFSLGSVMYFMLTGRSPFRAETTMGVLNRIGNDDPRSLREINADVPEWLEAIVMRLLSKDADGRYQSSSELAQLLKGWQAHLLDPTRADAPEPQRPTSLRTNVSGSGRKFGNKLPWILAAGMFGFLVWAATLIILQTDHGTLRIESSTDENLPIVIRKGDEIVDEVTVTREGASIQVKSGIYIVEIAGDVDGFEIQNDSVVIKRGATQVAKIIETKSVGDPQTDVISQMPDRSEPPKLSPFTRMEFRGQQVLVTYRSEQFELLEIDGFAIQDLVKQTKQAFGQKWKKRLSEDLVEVFWKLGHLPEESVHLKLKRLDSGKVVSGDAKMTEANRQALYRDNAHNQPVGRSVEDYYKTVLSGNTSVKADAVPLDEFLEKLSEQHRIPIILDQNNLKRAGITTNTAVSIEMQNVSLRMVLNIALAKVGCKYEVKNEIIRVFAAPKP
ncbi:Serine/threonine-protein kinase PknB [Stieleria neptunia]|uniref:non-specific serine/threonine protein kinase n=1 Tax=Stieleria neptunia TaxID=2527979 RepID=A0A518HT70_9BACT|nr:serine/threonine-protein kinase [Stieleria neptunia]QDV44036.1 Serine/threonine-protein kinase PknB [Stieleria neptunia]